MKAVIYARYSSDNQREESIEGQIRECTEYAKYNDIEVVGHYIDRAYSAKMDKRPDFQRMIKDSAKKNFQLVIVWKLDRFARNRYDSAIYKAALKKNGVRVISVTEHITDDATGGLMESIFEGFAEYYSAELAEKTKRGMKENALKGKWNGGQIPFGYMVKDSYLAIDETLAPIVRKLFEMCADGITVKDIHKYVQEKGILRPNGKKITYSSLRYLLSNRVYIGEYRHSGIIHENVVPAIVDKEVYDRAQEQISRTAHAPARHKAEDDYLLTLKLYCGHCGALMTAYAGTSMTGTLYRYYACNRARKKLCDKKRVNKQKIEDFVIYKIVELLKDGELLDRLAELLYSLQYKESTILPRLEEELCQKEKEIERIVDAIQKGIASDALMKRLAMLEEQKKVVEGSIEEEKEKSPVFTKDQFCMALYNFRKIDVNTQEGKRKLIDTFVNSIFLYDDRLKIVFNGGAKNEEISLSELESSYSIQAGQPKKRSTLLGASLFSCASQRTKTPSAMRVDSDARRGKARFAGVLLCETPRFLRLPLLFPKNLCAANLFRDRCGYETRGAAIRYSVSSASLRSARSSMIADEKAARQKTMKNNAFFMVFCYFECEEEKNQILLSFVVRIFSRNIFRKKIFAKRQVLTGTC